MPTIILQPPLRGGSDVALELIVSPAEHGQDFPKVIGQRRLHGQSSPIEWMGELEDGGMQQDAWENHGVSTPGAKAVDTVTKNRILYRTEMNTDLVGSTGVNSASQEAESTNEGTFQMPFGQ